MEDLLIKYDIRYLINDKFIFDINFYDVCTKLLNIDLIDDSAYINEDEFIDLLLSEDNFLDIDVKKFHRGYIEIIDSIPDEIIKPLKGYEKDYNTNIAACCKDNRITAYGYIWKFVDE